MWEHSKSDIQIKWGRLMIYKCPICLGCGNVPGGFYTVPIGHVQCWTSDKCSMEPCRACFGTGIVHDEKSNGGEVSKKKVNISLCKSCNCMTKTIKGKCGKCGAKKQNGEA